MNWKISFWFWQKLEWKRDQNRLLLIKNTNTFFTANSLLTAISNRESNNRDQQENSVIFRNDTLDIMEVQQSPVRAFDVTVLVPAFSLDIWRSKTESYNFGKVIRFAKNHFLNLVTTRLDKIIHICKKFHNWPILLIVYTEEHRPCMTKGREASAAGD